MDRGKVKYSMQDLYSLAWVFCLAFGTAVEIPSSPPLYAIGLLTDVVRASSRWQTQSPHSPMLRPTRERTLYVLVSLKRKKKSVAGGGADPSSQIPQPAAAWAHIPAPPPPPSAQRAAGNLHVLEWSYQKRAKQKSWAELSALTPRQVINMQSAAGRLFSDACSCAAC